jgi:hypothetical protein
MRSISTEEGIDGEALIHLEHDELRDIGIKSVGHRLTILKNIYHLKVAHGVTIEPEHYVPVCMLFHSILKSRVFLFSFLFPF